MRGPKPTPTALKIVRGNPGKRALPKDEPTPPAGEVDPDWNCLWSLHNVDRLARSLVRYTVQCWLVPQFLDEKFGISVVEFGIRDMLSIWQLHAAAMINSKVFAYISKGHAVRN